MIQKIFYNVQISNLRLKTSTLLGLCNINLTEITIVIRDVKTLLAQLIEINLLLHNSIFQNVSSPIDLQQLKKVKIILMLGEEPKNINKSCLELTRLRCAKFSICCFPLHFKFPTPNSDKGFALNREKKNTNP